MAHFLFFFINGIATLMLETVWLKKQMVLFGSVPGTYGSILSAYFIGVAAGSWYFGAIKKMPVRKEMLYFGFAAALAFSMVVPGLFAGPLEPLLSRTFAQPQIYNVLKWVIAFGALVPVCFYLGGFFPLLSSSVSAGGFVLLYGLQAAGALLGTVLGSFVLPYTFGYLLTGIIACGLHLLSLVFLHFISFTEVKREEGEAGAVRPPWRMLAMAGLSGFLSLTLQVLWIRFAAIGTDNSIFAFGSVSLIVLIMITVSSTVISMKAKKIARHDGLLGAVLVVASLCVVLSGFLFVQKTGGLQIRLFLNSSGFLSAFGFALSFALAGYLAPSLVFPILLSRSGGRMQTGLLLAVNGLCCAVGALLTSFYFLPELGIWPTLLLVAVGYALFPLLLPGSRFRFLGLVVSALVIFLFNPLKNPLVTPVNPISPGQMGKIIAVQEGMFGIVSVVEFGQGNRQLWLNNNYLLEAGRIDVKATRRLGILPTMLHPGARSCAMIGVATGITMSGFSHSDLTSIVGVELIPDVLDAGKRYFDDYNSGIFHDNRVRTVADDGRHFLNRVQEKYDLIVSDVFTPWNEGTSYLYTVEHFQSVKKRLADGGMFCLWLTCYQLTEEEIQIIMNSFATVFPNTTVWQLGPHLEAGVLGLVGGASIQTDAVSLAVPQRRKGRHPQDIIELHESRLFSRYVCPLPLPDSGKSELNTFDKPVIEFRAAGKGRELLVGKAYLDFIQKLYRLPANPEGRYFSRYDETLEGYRRAGQLLSQHKYAKMKGDNIQAQGIMKEVRELMPQLEEPESVR